MKNLQEKFREMLINSPSGVHGIFYSTKIKKGKDTGEISITHFVENKLPLNKLNPNDVIPKILIINDTKYITDVVQSGIFKTKQCNDLTSQSVVELKSRVRPLSGGLEISDLATWVQLPNGGWSLETGTLGFLAKDNMDGTLVGVTNAHVIIKDPFLVSERSIYNGAYNIYDPVVFNDPNQLTATYPASILQFGSSGGFINFNNDSIGIHKRYIPVSETQYNDVDCALIAINKSAANSSSAGQAGLPNSFGIPFATSTEIENLVGSNTPIYSVGAFTGPKGVTCPMKVYGIGNVYVTYNKQGNSRLVLQSDVLLYKFVDSSLLPIFSGDSGSAIIANINGVYKIIGLAFAGDTSRKNGQPYSTHGIACRIDNVANALDISAWDGGDIKYSDTNADHLSRIIRPANETRVSIEYNGKVYYQVGLENTSLPDTNI
jgi:hypothetical protein